MAPAASITVRNRLVKAVKPGRTLDDANASDVIIVPNVIRSVLIHVADYCDLHSDGDAFHAPEAR
ncbi:hypothetical protein E2562_012231 [Oryza meyeriana var. granulata]|uniref:Uncharacterized protein n=1 Tax=Oryza meyeriana var. granulata TaxID=110450 RepID=A0A6G1D2U7_9ORYZ|nr:hypothetical protein E2562_012231 [Oryza meyeriana var. granulata]